MIVMDDRSGPTPSGRVDDAGGPSRRARGLARPATLALASLVILAQFAVARVPESLARPLWLDEIHTALLVEDPSPAHALKALASGADYNPPASYALQRAVAGLIGSSGPITLRLTSLGAVLLGLLGVGLAVGRAYGREVGLACSVLAWAHPTLIVQALEARFYGPWFAGAVWFALALDRATAGRQTRVGAAMAAGLLSAFVCTVHYFGVISVGLAVAGVAACRWRTRRQFVVGALAVAPGLLALAACLPIYRGQRAALSAPTWLDEGHRSMQSIYNFLGLCYQAPLLAIVLGAAFASIVSAGERDEPGGQDARSLGGLGALAAMPLVLGVFTALVQPANLPRYAIPAVGGLAALVAPVLARARRAFLWAATAALLLVGTAYLRGRAVEARQQVAERDAALAALASLDGHPVAFRKRDLLYQCWRDAPEARRGWTLWDASELGPPGPFDAVEVEVAAILADLYGMPPVAAVASWPEGRPGYLVGFEPEEVRDLAELLPGRAFREVDPSIGLFELRPGANQPHGRVSATTWNRSE